ncbi:MAG: ATP-binding cassette domain-containing protein, partial [Solirubrobacterales bacterium]|nr:ATP-binding cassette domain-containing protein [Solirubrobacterales bacterium]
MTAWDLAADHPSGERPIPGRVRLRTDSTPRVATVPPTNGVRPEPTRAVVFDIHDMAVYYGQNCALAHTSLKVYRNQVTAVIGPSGCGKSTFIR